MTPEEIKQEFERRRPLYEKLASNIVDALKLFFKEKAIEYVEITHRIKDFDSFKEKIERKSCKEPFHDIADICGIRVIYYYDSDTPAVDEVIETEFEVVESEKKSSEQEQSSFGYRSNHFVVKIPQTWLPAPNYRGVKELKAEIQTRTILMHAWASISHKLSYKKESDVPKEFQRSLFRLSALIELADQQFDILREERKKYAGSLVRNVSKGERVFDVSTPLNLDSLKTYLNYLCPDRESEDDALNDLLVEMTQANVSLEEIDAGYKKIRPYLRQIEGEAFKIHGEGYWGEGINLWSKMGFVRTILDLTCPRFYANRSGSVPKELEDLDKKWIQFLKKIKP